VSVTGERRQRWTDWASHERDLRRIGRSLALVWRSAPGWTVLSTVLIVVQTVATLAGLYLLKLIVDAVAAGLGADAPEGTAATRVLLLIALAGAVAILTVVSRSLAMYAAEAKAQLVKDHMLNRLYAKSLAVDFAYYENPAYHNTLHRAQMDAPYRPVRLLTSLINVVQNGITAAGVLVLLASAHWILAAVIIAAVAPAFLVHVQHSRRLNRWIRGRSETERQSDYYAWIMADPQHAKEMRVFDLGQEIIRRFRGLQTRIRQERLELIKARSAADAASQIVAAVVVFGSLAFIGHQALKGVLTLGDMVMYFGAVQRGQSLLQGFFSGLGSLYEDNLFLANVDEFLEIEPAIAPPPQPRDLPDAIGRGLQCQGLAFRYPSSPRPILQDIDLEVRPGQIVAIVGPNGSGKTTLVKLLCRLYDPEAGCITLDGIDIREFDPIQLRRKFAVVFQDYACYNVSVRDNIWFGNIRRSRSLDDVRVAAETAGVDTAIARLQHGYDTVLGRIFFDGEELSVGEWQKLALARAFMSDGDILVVDEPTSALDAHAEAEVTEALGRLFRDRAAIVISHRLSTVKKADRIYFLDEGRIVEQGTHVELMRLTGRYAALYNQQAISYRIGVSDAPPVARPEAAPAAHDHGAREPDREKHA
jgi:ATP-binding cassette, subfamily B, bacterial